MRTDLRIGVCNGCLKVRDSVRKLAMVCEASVVHVMPHVGVSVLRVACECSTVSMTKRMHPYLLCVRLLGR